MAKKIFKINRLLALVCQTYPGTKTYPYHNPYDTTHRMKDSVLAHGFQLSHFSPKKKIKYMGSMLLKLGINKNIDVVLLCYIQMYAKMVRFDKLQDFQVDLAKFP